MAEWCPRCRRMIGIGCSCGLSFAEKARSLVFARAETQRRNYFDQQSIDEVFGPDAKERMLDESNGIGPVYSRKGWYYRKVEGGMEPITPQQLDWLLGGDREEG